MNEPINLYNSSSIVRHAIRMIWYLQLLPAAAPWDSGCADVIMVVEWSHARPSPHMVSMCRSNTEAITTVTCQWLTDSCYRKLIFIVALRTPSGTEPDLLWSQCAVSRREGACQLPSVKRDIIYLLGKYPCVATGKNSAIITYVWPCVVLLINIMVPLEFYRDNWL